MKIYSEVTKKKVEEAHALILTEAGKDHYRLRIIDKSWDSWWQIIQMSKKSSKDEGEYGG